MGCSIGERLRRHGARVLTSLAGRSAATVERATRAGLIDADDDAIAAADFILSIVPPKDAMAIAQRFQGTLRRSSKKAVYIDCNAVSVETVAAIEPVVTASGGRFVDGSIVAHSAREGSNRSDLSSGGRDAVGRCNVVCTRTARAVHRRAGRRGVCAEDGVRRTQQGADSARGCDGTRRHARRRSKRIARRACIQSTAAARAHRPHIAGHVPEGAPLGLDSRERGEPEPPPIVARVGYNPGAG